MENKERYRSMMLSYDEFHKCPNSGRILDSPKHDDKALCNCGETSPGLKKRGFKDAPGVHLKSFLPTATFDEWWDQKVKDDAKWEKHKRKE